MRICEAGRDACGCKEFTKGIRTIDGQYPDDNREFKIIEGAGILITPVTAGIKITNIQSPGVITAGQNIDVSQSGDNLVISTTDDIHVNGDLNVDGDIIQQGASYETHMEQVYTTDDYIIMRDGAVSALPNGQYAGFQVKKYDGTNDGRLVIDNTGTARVGDVGDEQPLLTRVESNLLTDGDIMQWVSANQNVKGVGVDSIPTINNYHKLVTSGGVYDALLGKQNTLSNAVSYPESGFTMTRYGNVVTISVFDVDCGQGVSTHGSGIPAPTSYSIGTIVQGDFSYGGVLKIGPGEHSVAVSQITTGKVYGSITYITSE